MSATGTVAIFYAPSADAIMVGTIPAPITPASLRATATGDWVTVAPREGGANLVVALYSAIVRRDGSGFASASDCVAYLTDQFSRCRLHALTVAFDTPATDWVVHHDLDFMPSVTACDSAGQVLLVGVVRVDESTILVQHAAPTSGVVYLS